MKTNIIEVDYYNTRKHKKGSGWWTWKEVCNICGSIMYDVGEKISQKKPKKNKDIDRCLTCWRQQIDKI